MSASNRITLLDKWKLLQAIVADQTVRNGEKVVAARMLQFLNNETGRCDPSYGKIAVEVGMKRATVIAAIKNLENAGWVSINRSKTGFDRETGRPETNQFEFNFARPHSDGRKRRSSARKQTGPSAEKGTPPSARKQTNPVPENRLTQCPKTDSPSPENGTLNTSREIHQGNTSIENGERELFPPVKKKAEPARRTSPLEAELRRAFEKFWAVYPRPTGQPYAFKAFAQAVRAGASPAEIIDGAARFAAERVAQEPDPAQRERFTPYPANWLNRKGWTDPPPPAPSSNRNTRGDAENFTLRVAAAEHAKGARDLLSDPAYADAARILDEQ